MARNRRKQSAVGLVPLLKALVLCLLVGGAGLGYVWLKEQSFALGRQLKEREKQVEKLRRQNKDYSDCYATLCTPAMLESQIARWGLGLAMPEPDQVVRLPEPVVGVYRPVPAERPPAVTQIAARQSTALIPR